MQQAPAPAGDSWPTGHRAQYRVVALENLPGGHRVHPVAELLAFGWLPIAHVEHASWAAGAYVPLVQGVQARVRLPFVAEPATQLCTHVASEMAA